MIVYGYGLSAVLFFVLTPSPSIQHTVAMNFSTFIYTSVIIQQCFVTLTWYFNIKFHDRPEDTSLIVSIHTGKTTGTVFIIQYPCHQNLYHCVFSPLPRPFTYITPLFPPTTLPPPHFSILACTFN